MFLEKQRLSGVLKKFAGVQEAKDAKNSLDLRVHPAATNGFSKLMFIKYLCLVCSY